MNFERNISSKALEFEQTKGLRNLDNSSFIEQILELLGRELKLKSLEFEKRKGTSNIINAQSHRENYDEAFRNKRKIWRIDFDQNKALRTVV